MKKTTKGLYLFRLFEDVKKTNDSLLIYILRSKIVRTLFALNGKNNTDKGRKVKALLVLKIRF
jgi:hypothetical protein